MEIVSTRVIQFTPLPPDFGPKPTDPKVNEFAANNLRNPKFFPAYEHCAPYKAYSPKEEIQPLHHWCYLGEIVQDKSSPSRVALVVKDKDGECIQVVFQFNQNETFDAKIGFTLAVMYAERHEFVDGSYGFRLEYPNFAKIFPCTLDTLLRINDDIESETPADSSQKCKACGKEEHPDTKYLLPCSHCLAASYCGTKCQVDGWEQSHKHECEIFKALDDVAKTPFSLQGIDAA
ncbi:hypothetical protein B0H19DRAFT_1276983 [Mycena capillaripes]|nr:hypothetical protein B0H19DRAFT_1276983 [Mycena capillaripes]